MINVPSIADAAITHYPYRTARVMEHQLIGSCDYSPETDDLQRRLAEASHVRPDNHTVYKIEWQGQDTVYIMFSDGQMRIGRDALVEDWD